MTTVTTNDDTSAALSLAPFLAIASGAVLTPAAGVITPTATHHHVAAGTVSSIVTTSISANTEVFLLLTADGAITITLGATIIGRTTALASGDQILYVLDGGTAWREVAVSIATTPEFVLIGSDIRAAVSALSALGGGTLVLSARTYSYSATIDLSGFSNVIIRGQGYASCLSFSGVDIGIGGTGCTRISLESLRIAGTSARGISFSNSSQVTVHKCIITGATLAGVATATAGLYLSACDDCVIEQNRFESNGYGQTAITGTVSGTATFPVLTGVGTLFLTQIVVGQPITISSSSSVSEIRNVLSITNNLSLTLTAPLTNSYAGVQVARTVASLDVYFVEGGSRNKFAFNTCVSTAVTMNVGLETTGGGQTCDGNEFVGNKISGAITRFNATAWGYPLYAYSATSPITNTRFALNDIRDAGGNGIYMQSLTAAVCEGNLLTNTVTAMTGGALTEGAIAANSGCTRLAIYGNVIRTSGKAGIRCDASYSLIAQNNISATVGAGILYAASTIDLSVCGNILQATAGGGIITIPATTHQRLTISYNTIDGTIGSGAYGIYVETATVVKVIGNTVKGVGAYGIIVQTATDFDVSHNTVRDVSGFTNNTFDGIVITDGTNGIIYGNKSFNSGGTGARYGLNAATLVAVAITDNQLAPNVTGSIALASLTAVTRRGNRLSTTGALQGRAVLVAGTVTVANAEIKTGDDASLANVVAGGTFGALSLGTIVDSTSFVINSSNVADTSTVLFEIVH